MGKALGLGVLTIVFMWFAVAVLAVSVIVTVMIVFLAIGLLYYIFLLVQAEDWRRPLGALALPTAIYLIVGKISWVSGLPYLIAGDGDIYGGNMGLGGLMVYFGAHLLLFPVVAAFWSSAAFAIKHGSAGSAGLFACVTAFLTALPGGGIDYWLHLPNGNYAIALL